MKLPPVVWLVIATLCAAAASLGLFFGGLDVLDEGEVILYYAEQYTRETGEPREDCHARPGRRSDVWLVVICEGATGRYAYPVGHDGALIGIEGDEA